ncbi:hypothetical protein ACFQZE_06510 [Paenibacillus sp. GCM10027627]|uniref:hypothetical protein n=1 Tax=unclassified Paenibacillus TaxID=185978 RepID=UPI003638399F
MNLYKIMFEHFSPKDSQRGVVAYLVADSDEQVYEWLKSDPKLDDDTWIYTPYQDSENDDITFELYDDQYNVVGMEEYKDKMIRLKGEMFDDELELNDLYYGKTIYGWRLIKEDVKPDILQYIKDYGIKVVNAMSQ